MRASFVWDDTFKTGLPRVDEQHQELVNLFNELALTLFVHGPNEEALLPDVYERLLASTRLHFTEEEAQMQQAGLEPRALRTHAEAHRQFVEQLERLWGQRRSLTDLRTTLVQFLTSWLSLHILGMDQSMARQLKAIARGLSPAQAFELEGEAEEPRTRALLKGVTSLYAALTAQNRQLVQAHQQLEARLAERTRELHEAHVALGAMVRTDGLLGIANRAHFDERIEQACSLAWRQERTVGVLLLNMDFFARYHEHFGPQEGNACLQAVTCVIAACLPRETDLLARYGDDEWVLLLPDTDRQGCMQVAQRVLGAVRIMQRPHPGSEVSPYVTLSVGACSRVPAPMQPGSIGSGAAALIASAREALERAKTEGRDRCVAG